MCGAKSDDDYQEVWSTWSITDPIAKSKTNATKRVVQDAPTVNVKDEMRFRVQERRIEQCMSITEVAQSIQCDERVLASYERGKLILRDEVIERLRKLFKLP